MARPKTTVPAKEKDPERQLAGALSATDYVQERAQLVRVQRELAELKLAVQKGELLPAKMVAEAWTNEIARCRALLLGLAHRVAPMVALESDMRRVQEIIEDDIRQALTELAQPDERTAANA